MKKNLLWYQWNIYHHGNMDMFVKICIRQIIIELKKQNSTIPWFFIRYWQGGPHIRLRVKTVEDNLVDNIIRKNVKEYSLKYPSEDLDKDVIRLQQKKFGYLESMEIDSSQIYDNNTIVFTNYIPELDKYGTGDILKLSEKQFMISSNYALDAVNQIDTITDKYLFTIISFLEYFRIMNYEIENMIYYLYKYCELWLNYLEIEKNQWEIVMKKKCENQKDKIGEIVKNILDNNSEYCTNKFYLIWKKENDKVIYELEKHFGVSNYKNEKICKLILNYMHVHNNRLGIVPAEEAYLSFLLKSALEEMIRREPI